MDDSFGEGFSMRVLSAPRRTVAPRCKILCTLSKIPVWRDIAGVDGKSCALDGQTYVTMLKSLQG